MKVTKLSEHIAAEVTGLDLRVTLDAAAVTQLKSTLAEYLVVLVPGQTLTPVQYRDALSHLGEPMYQHREQFNLPECREVSRVANHDGFPPAVNWHTDHTNHELPPKITALYGVAIPRSGGDTGFANMVSAYESLPLAERHSLASIYTLNSMEDDPSYRAEDRARYRGDVRHPMVRVHPDTAKPALYFHVSKSQGIEGMAREMVRPFLESLLERSIKPEFVYRHQWRAGDVVICDNHAAMHRVYADYHRDDYRLLWRVILRGERPVGRFY